MVQFGRTLCRIFALNNDVYAGATVAFHAVDPNTGARLATLIKLYQGLTGTGEVSNPQVLDALGKLIQPVYYEDPFIAEISQAAIPAHATGSVLPDVVGLNSFAGDPNSQVAGFFIGERVWDTTNEIEWVCTTIGDAATAVWRAIGGGGSWQFPLQMGASAHRLWVDAAGRLMIKNGVPTSDSDGTVVGTQS